MYFVQRALRVSIRRRRFHVLLLTSGIPAQSYRICFKINSVPHGLAKLRPPFQQDGLSEKLESLALETCTSVPMGYLMEDAHPISR